MRKCVAVPDLHFPFVSKKKLERLFSLIERERPRYVVQVGDLYDFLSSSRFPRSQNGLSPEAECAVAREGAEWFWRRVREAAPKSQCYQLLGNHDMRPVLRAIEKAPELEHLIREPLKKLLTFRGVETILSAREDLELEGVVFEHGHLTRAGAHLRQNMKPTVFGHLHRPYVHYEQIRGRVLWEFNCGYLADPASPGLSYTPKKQVNWVQGCGLIDAQGPRFIPL